MRDPETEIKEPQLMKMAWHASSLMMSGIIVGSGAGFLLHHYLNFGIWVVILGFMFGMAAGFLNVWRLIKKDRTPPSAKS